MDADKSTDSDGTKDSPAPAESHEHLDWEVFLTQSHSTPVPVEELPHISDQAYSQRIDEGSVLEVVWHECAASNPPQSRVGEAEDKIDQTYWFAEVVIVACPVLFLNWCDDNAEPFIIDLDSAPVCYPLGHLSSRKTAKNGSYVPRTPPELTDITEQRALEILKDVENHDEEEFYETVNLEDLRVRNRELIFPIQSNLHSRRPTAAARSSNR